MKSFMQIALMGMLFLALMDSANAQDKWVGKTVALPDSVLFFYKLDDAALWSSLAGEDVDTSSLGDFFAYRGNQIKILESSYNAISPGDKFYKAKVLTGPAKGNVAWFDGFQLKSMTTTTTKKVPSAIPKETYPKAGGY